MTTAVPHEPTPPLARKRANTLNPTALPRLNVLQRVLAGPALWVLRRRFGGLWIGGDVNLWPDRLEFLPNQRNAALHHGDLAWSLPLSDITSVTCVPASVTDIIAIAHPAGITRIRCYGAQAFAQQIDTARPATSA